MDSSKRSSILKISVVFLTIPVCYFVLYEYSDLFNRDLIFSKLNKIGLSILIIFIPYLFIVLSDSFGWKYSFGKIKNQISSVKLFLLRLATETLQNSLPAGAVYAEVVRPILLKKYFMLEYCNSISANIITKVNILVAQVLFFIIGLALTIIFVRDKISLQLLPDYLLYPALAIVIIFPIVSTYMLYRKKLLLRLFSFFNKIKLQSVKNFICRIIPSVIKINDTISHFSKSHKKELFSTVALFFLTWFLMSFESFVILKVIDVDVNIFQIIVIESLISFVRMIFFFIPGAVGAQDVVVIILFNLSGIPDAQTNALVFLLFKRFKEFFWIVIGYILLIILGISPYKLIKDKKIDFTPVKETL